MSENAQGRTLGASHRILSRRCGGSWWQACLIGFLLLVLGVACDSEEPETGQQTQSSLSTTEAATTPKGVWIVLEAGGRPKPLGAIITITEEGISGDVYCNKFGGGLKFTPGGSFETSDTMVTDEECVPIEAEAMAAVVGFLGRATNWELSDDGDSLSLSSEHGEELLLKRK